MRPPIHTLTRLLLGLLIGLGTCFITPQALAQDFMQVPNLYTRSPEVFRALFEGARSSTVTGIIMGDSQETCPGGAGAIYIPRFQFEFWDRYGNAPQTPLAPMAASYGTSPVYADWLLRVANASPGMTGSRLQGSALPPGISAGATSTLNGSNVNNNQWYAQLVMLQQNAADVHPATNLRGGTYFHLSPQVYVDVFAATNLSSGELRVDASFSPTSAPSYFVPTVATFFTSMGLQDPLPAIRSQRLGPLPFGPSGYLQIAISGTDSSKLTDVIGARFVNTARPEGWTFTSLSAGGYAVDDALTRHGDSGPVLAALNPDVLLISFGANDCGRGVTADQFQAGISLLIEFVRSSTRPDLPVILLTDPFRYGLTPAFQEQHDLYPRAMYNIALQDPLVCAVNSRRLTHEFGWTPTSGTTYLSDNVHYTAAGAFAKSRLEASALFDAFLPPPLCDPDLNQDGNVDQDDVTYLINVVGGGPNPTGIDPDFNHDGNADQDDVNALLQRVGGGDCP